MFLSMLVSPNKILMMLQVLERMDPKAGSQTTTPEMQILKNQIMERDKYIKLLEVVQTKLYGGIKVVQAG